MDAFSSESADQSAFSDLADQMGFFDPPDQTAFSGSKGKLGFSDSPDHLGLLLIAIGISALIVTALVLWANPDRGHSSLFFSAYDGKVSDGNLEFSFVVENNFSTDKVFDFRVLVDGNIVREGSLPVSNGSRAKQFVSIPFEMDVLRLKKVLVQLPDANQEIFFWAGLKPVASFVNNLALISADATPSVVTKDGNLLLEFVWKAAVPIDENYLIFVHFTEASGAIAFQKDHYPVVDGNLFQTSEWMPGSVVSERIVFPIPDGVKDGNYSLHVGFFLPEKDRVKTIRGDDFAVIKTIAVID